MISILIEDCAFWGRCGAAFGRSTPPGGAWGGLASPPMHRVKMELIWQGAYAAVRMIVGFCLRQYDTFRSAEGKNRRQRTPYHTTPSLNSMVIKSAIIVHRFPPKEGVRDVTGPRVPPPACAA